MNKLHPINYRKRMERAMDAAPGAAVLVMAMPEASRNSDVDHPYRTDSTMYYLTGFDEPESALLLVAQPSGERKAIAFVRKRNPEAELWTGRRLGVEEAPKTLGVDEAYAFEALWEELPRLVKGVDRIYYAFGRCKEQDGHFIDAMKVERRLRGRHSIASTLPVFDVEHLAGQLRLIKDEDDLARMRIAARISKQAYDVVFASVRPGMSERQVHGMLIGEFMRGGAEMEAYPSIVGGGANACCLHYHANNAELKDGTLLLIDAGAQFEYYASDVTRTFPIGKKFTAEQKAVYEVVLDIQLKGIAMSRPGSSMQDLHEKTCRYMTEGLVSLGLLKGNVDQLFEDKAFRKYFPHGTGHWLGMDVHDVGDYVQGSGPMPLKPGMVFTVEPGIYIEPNDQSVPPGFRGIGIRIEDDIVVTNGAPEVLTHDIPKTVAALENRY